MKSQSTISVLLAGATTWSAVAIAQDGKATAAPVPTPIVYHNTQYGFCLLLPADWKGYRVIRDTWRGYPGGDMKASPMEVQTVSLRNPRETKDDQYQDIPIMIFTTVQWKRADDYTFSAAPYGPGKIGSNKNYVFALPPRWIGFTDAKGQDEVQVLMNEKPFEAPCGHRAAQPVKDIP